MKHSQLSAPEKGNPLEAVIWTLGKIFLAEKRHPVMILIDEVS
jgi:hypothetical protein